MSIALGEALALPSGDGVSLSAPAMSTLFTPLPPTVPNVGSPSTSPTGSGADSALDSAADPPVSVVSLPRHSPSTPLVDDVPEVALQDVVTSVARATVGALPWLHLGPRPQGDRLPARDAPIDPVRRTGPRDGFEAERPARQGADAVPIDLARVALDLAGELLVHPLTWIVGVPTLLAGFVLAALRHRRK